MERHVRIIGLLYVFLGASLVLLGVGVLFLFGGAALSGSDQPNSSGSGVVVSLVGAVGGIVFLLLSLLSIPALVAGVGLLRHRPWARIATILLSGFVLFVPFLTGFVKFVPLSTLLGLYSLWVLLSKRAEPIFTRQAGS
jgi:hypothetical protein